MSIVVQSVGTLASSTTSSITINKPTGLAVGDLMVAVMGAHGTTTSSGTTYSTLAGWTSALGANYNNRVAFSVQYRYADAGDVAASNFTFSLSNTSFPSCTGQILRCTGMVPSGFNPLGTTDSETQLVVNSATLSGTLSSYTPAANGALVIMQVGAYNTNNSRTVSGYDTTASGITFTELFDVGSGSSTTAMYSSAYGIQTTAAALTAYTATWSAAVVDHYAQFVVFLPVVNASGSNTLATAVASSFVQSGTCDTIGNNTLVTTLTQSFTQGGQGTSPTQWSNESKPSTTWVNDQL